MGHDQSKEADGADHGGGYAGEQHGDDGNYDAAAVDIHAERACGLVLKRKKIALSGGKEREDDPHRNIGRQCAKIVPRFHRNICIDDACDAGIVGTGAGVECAHQSREHGVDRHADEDDPQRRQPVFIGQAVNENKCEHSAEESKQRCEEIERRHERGYEHRRKACAGADADDAGIGQRIFHHGLQKHA